MKNVIKNTHKLDFLAMPYTEGLAATIMALTNPLPVMAFKVGTCEGIYQVSKDAYEIIAIRNNEPGNGHFEDVLQWFEFSCRRDAKSLRFLEILNEKFGKHLAKKRGFTVEGTNMVNKFPKTVAKVTQ